jgi:hypothetical protein
VGDQATQQPPINHTENGAAPSQPATTTAPATTQPAPDLGAIAKTLNEVLETVKKHDGKISDLGKGLGKVREKVREPEAGDPRPAPALTHADLDSAMKLGQLSAKLPESAQAAIQKLRDEGASYQTAATFAQTMLDALSSLQAPATGVRTAVDPPVPTGAAATSAPRTSPAHPRSLSEFAEIKRKDPDRFKQLMSDPTFHPDELPSVLNR